MTKIEHYPHYVGLDEGEFALTLAGLRALQQLVIRHKYGGWIHEVDQAIVNDVLDGIWPPSPQIDRLANRLDELCERVNLTKPFAAEVSVIVNANAINVSSTRNSRVTVYDPASGKCDAGHPLYTMTVYEYGKLARTGLFCPICQVAKEITNA